MGMHPALHSWREELPAAFVRWLAYVCGAVALSIAAAHVFQSRPVTSFNKPALKPAWVAIEKPFAAFALAIPEAADAPSHYAILHNRHGGGRKDILSLGEINSAEPYLQVEIYRPGRDIARFPVPAATIAGAAADLGPVQLRPSAEPLASKFGPLTILTFDTSNGVRRHCLGFVRADDEPRLQISGWFCRGGEPIQRATLACALDRLMLLSAGSEPKIGALFAKAELHRNFCGEHDPILASTPSFKLLWKAALTRPAPRRIGR
jgi:hypothetical protein